MTEARPAMRWGSKHFRYIHAQLDRITAGEIKRLILQVSVRHGKTETLISYAAQRIEDNPALQVLVCSYSQQQADKLSRDIRAICESRGVKMSGKSADREWETASGGGVRSVGAGAGVASVNAQLVIVDDPVGNRAEAESAAHRDRVWDWITNDILARCVPVTAVIVSHPRWHQDDPIGRLRDRQSARWTVVDLPGRAEANDPLGRAEGEPLWPEERGEDWLVQMREEVLEYGFASLVQGRPRPREGGMFKWAWWGELGEVPASGRMIRYWDLAGTKQRSAKHDPDYTAGALLCRMDDNRTAIVEVARFRSDIAQRDAELARICVDDMRRYPGRVTWWMESESGIGGRDRTDAILRMVQAHGMAMYAEPATGEKTLRAEPLASAAGAGNVLLCPDRPDMAWRDIFRSECADAPHGSHDDQWDAASGAFNKLAVPAEWRATRVSY